MPAGRPRESVPQDKAKEIIAWIADGKTLREFCRQEGNPCYGAVYDWLAKDEDFAKRFARARNCGQDVIAEDCIEIADTEADPNRAKVRIWTRLQLLAKWNPKKYGEKLQVDGELGIKTVIVQAPVKDTTARPAAKPSFDEE